MAPPISISTLPFQGYPSFLAKFLVGPTPLPPFNKGGGGSNYAVRTALEIRSDYMKIHFASAFPQQCFCRGWQDFMLRASVFTLATLANISTRSKLVRLFSLLHISPKIRSIMCTNVVVQILLYAMQCALSSL